MAWVQSVKIFIPPQAETRNFAAYKILTLIRKMERRRPRMQEVEARLARLLARIETLEAVDYQGLPRSQRIMHLTRLKVMQLEYLRVLTLKRNLLIAETTRMAIGLELVRERMANNNNPTD